MMSSFWFGYLEDFLFQDFDIESPLGLIAICIAIAVLVIIFELLKTTSVIKKLKFYTFDGRSLFKLAFLNSSEKSTLIQGPENVKEVWKVSDLYLHFLELTIGYILMMMAMTLNAYVMISICVGAAIAYLLMGTAIMNITAQVVTKKMCMGCHNKGGECTPVTELLNEGPSTSFGEVLNVPSEDLLNRESITVIQAFLKSYSETRAEVLL